MKHIFTLAALFLGRAILPAQELSFEQVSHDFGLISEVDGSVSHDFRFTNIGS